MKFFEDPPKDLGPLNIGQKIIASVILGVGACAYLVYFFHEFFAPQ